MLSTRNAMAGKIAGQVAFRMADPCPKFDCRFEGCKKAQLSSQSRTTLSQCLLYLWTLYLASAVKAGKLEFEPSHLPKACPLNFLCGGKRDASQITILCYGKYHALPILPTPPSSHQAVASCSSISERRLTPCLAGIPGSRAWLLWAGFQWFWGWSGPGRNAARAATVYPLPSVCPGRP